MKPVTCALVGIALASSVQANDSPQGLQDSFMEALLAGDAEAISVLYADDAVSYDVAAQSVSGPEGVKASWGGFFEANTVLSAELFNNTVETHGDTGIAWGEFRMTVEPAGGGDPVEMVGRFSDVSRNFDGTWMYVMDHVSMPLPPPPEE